MRQAPEPQVEATPRHHYILGMRLDYKPVDTFVREFVDAASVGASVYCCVPDVYQCTVCYDQAGHQKIVNEADFVMSDSKVLQTIRSLVFGVAPVKPLLGSDLMLALCDEAARRSIPIALIGGRNQDVLAELEEALLKKAPGLQIAYSYSPPFREMTPKEEQDMLSGLSQSGARLVFVGIGCPKQERWMAQYKDRLNAALIGVGAAFDTISGRVPASPPFVHKLGLEWLFRLCREPRRLYKRYLGAAPKFLWLVFWEFLRRSPRRA